MNERVKRLYLVTGAAGHLGSAVLRALAGRNADVRALCLEGEKHLPENVRVYYGDVCRRETLTDFFEGTGADTVVIHCAGIVSISSAYVRKVYDVNVTGTKNITDMCMEKGVGKLIYVSSVHAIPEKPRGTVMTEPENVSPDEVSGLYASTKAEATAYVKAAAKRGLDAEIVYPSGIIGPYDYGRSHTNQLVADYAAGRLTAAVNGGYDFVDVRDVAEGILSCADLGRKGEGYILSGGFHTIREILTVLRKLTNGREIKTYLPVKFVVAVAPLCGLYYKLRREPPLFTKYSVKVLSGNAAFSNEKARKYLNFTARDIGETLSDTLEWLRANGRAPAL